MRQVNIIEITKHGNDVAVTVNGHFLIGGDPSCGDDTSTVYRMAGALSTLFGAEVVTHRYAPEEGWNWDEVCAALGDKLLSKADPHTTEPAACPVCGSDDISAGHMEFDIGTGWRTCSCGHCDFAWKEEYTFTRWGVE